jgi:competence protein ComEC
MSTGQRVMLAEPPDARLVPAALGAWGVAVLGLTAGWQASAWATAAAVLLAALGARRRTGATLLAAAGCAAAVGLLVTVQAFQLVRSPVYRAAAQGSAATVRVSLTGDPAPVFSTVPGDDGGAAGPAQVAVRAELVDAEIAGRHWHGGGRVLLLAPTQGWAGLLPGTEVSASGLLAPATRPDLTVAVLRVRGPPVPVAGPPWWQRGAGALREGLRQASSVLPERSAELLPGLVVGDTSRMSPALRDEFRTTGLTHLTAVSGTNVAIIAGAVFGLLALCRAGPRGRAAGALLALVGFVVLARPSPSVLRAAVMGGVGLLAVLSGRQRSLLPALAASVIVLLLVDPALGTDPGFVLSVLATGALVLIVPGWSARLRRAGVPPGVAEVITVPLAAHLVTAPVIAGLSGRFSLVAVLANLLAAPAVAPVTVLGVLAAVIAPVSPVPARLLVRLAGPGVNWLVGVAHWGAGVPGAALSWPSGMWGGLAMAAALAGSWFLLRGRRVRALAAAVLLGVLLVFVPTRYLTPGWPATGWAMVACDVGQGDSLVLATGRPGSAVLVDTGTDAGAVDPCLTRLRVHSLALVVLTHMHADHVGGLSAALAGRGVGAIAVGPTHVPDRAFAAVQRTAVAHRAPVLALRAGQRLSWPALTLQVLGPDRPDPGIDPDDGTEVNNTSLIIRAGTPAGSVMLTGDAELAAQSALLVPGADLRADVLKMPHHGSRKSDPRFLAAVHPRVVLVSVGAGNPYRQPNLPLLGRLRATGALVLRTDLSGDIAVTPGPAGPVTVARGDPLPAPTGARRRLDD